jgi:hypothetical protein
MRLFAALSAAMVLVVMALGSLPSERRVERAAARGAVPERGDEADGPTAAAPAPPTTATTAPPPGFGDGVHLVGDEVVPGRYAATGELCSWERLRRPEPGPGDVVAADTSSGQTLVEILATDGAFSSSGCGRWTRFDGGAPLDAVGQGTFAVGTQMAVGTWRSDGPDLCYWERLSGLTGRLEEIVASAGVAGSVEVQVAPEDVAFSSFGCGTWTPAG